MELGEEGRGSSRYVWVYVYIYIYVCVCGLEGKGRKGLERGMTKWVGGWVGGELTIRMGLVGTYVYVCVCATNLCVCVCICMYRLFPRRTSTVFA